MPLVKMKMYTYIYICMLQLCVAQPRDADTVAHGPPDSAEHARRGCHRSCADANYAAILGTRSD